jgi:hypothetical protein
MKIDKNIILGALAALWITTLTIAAENNNKSSSERLQTELFGISTLQGDKAVFLQIIMTQIEQNKMESSLAGQIGPLKASEIDTQVRAALQLAGIKLAESYGKPTEEAPLSLGISITVTTTVINNEPLYAVFVGTEVHQPVQLLRDNTIRTVTRTWPMTAFGVETSCLFILNQQTLDKTIKKEVGRQAGRFINDYLAANPKEQTPQSPPKKDVKSSGSVLPIPEEGQIIPGTVLYIPTEGGYYGILSDKGAKYVPINLPDEYKKDGLRVNFQFIEKKEIKNDKLWGAIIEIKKIENR